MRCCAAIGLDRATNVYIANVLKSRPPGNRDPKPEEVAACLPYLVRQIELLQPRIMLAVGRIAAQNLLGTQAPLGRLRGQVHHFGELNTPLVVTYHPAYLLRTPGDKRKAWEDLKFARSVYQRLTLKAPSRPMATAPELFAAAPEMTIRPMRAADVADVVAIERASYQFPWSEGIFRDCLRVGYICRVVTVGRRVMGYGVMSVGAGEAHILNLCVAAELPLPGPGPAADARADRARRRAPAWARRFWKCGLPTPTAIRLYLSLGFEQMGMRRGYYQAVGGREDAAVLRLAVGGPGAVLGAAPASEP